VAQPSIGTSLRTYGRHAHDQRMLGSHDKSVSGQPRTVPFLASFANALGQRYWFEGDDRISAFEGSDDGLPELLAVECKLAAQKPDVEEVLRMGDVPGHARASMYGFMTRATRLASAAHASSSIERPLLRYLKQ